MLLSQPIEKNPKIHLESLTTGRCGITASYGATLCEAASVCISQAKHQNPTIFKIDGHTDLDADVLWNLPTQQMLNTWNDDEYTTEQGAYCLAALFIEEFGLEVVQRSRKRTGFDFWLGVRGSKPEGFQGLSRLEVSGIRSGDTAKINQREKIKQEQTKKSDSSGLPSVVAIIEFTTPTARITQRCNS